MDAAGYVSPRGPQPSAVPGPAIDRREPTPGSQETAATCAPALLGWLAPGNRAVLQGWVLPPRQVALGGAGLADRAGRGPGRFCHLVTDSPRQGHMSGCSAKDALPPGTLVPDGPARPSEGRPERRLPRALGVPSPTGRVFPASVVHSCHLRPAHPAQQWQESGSGGPESIWVPGTSRGSRPGRTQIISRLLTVVRTWAVPRLRSRSAEIRGIPPTWPSAAPQS